MLKENKKAKKWTSMLCALVTTSTLLFQLPAISYGAEKNEFSLEQVVVTANRIPTKILESAANVTVINQEQIEKGNYKNLTDALSHVNGIAITAQGFPGGEQYVSLNGDERVVIMIDGRRINLSKLPGVKGGRATYDLNNFPTLDNIERIEIVKGAASALYGSEAVGGAINIITRQGNKNQSTFSIDSGSWKKHNYKFTNQGKESNWSWFFTAGKATQDHFAYKDFQTGKTKDMSNSAYEQKNMTLRLDKEISPDKSLTFNFEHANDHKGAPYMVDGRKDWYGNSLHFENDYLNTLTNNYAVTYNFNKTLENAGYLRVYENYFNYNMNQLKNGNWQVITFKNKESGFEWQDGWRLNENNLLVGGAQWRDTKVNYPSYYGDKGVNNKAIYLEDRMNINEDWTLTPGVRYDHHNMFGSKITPRATLNYKVDDNTNMYVAWGKVFNAPTTDDLFWPDDPSMGCIGNPNLKPETGYTTTVGINKKMNEKIHLKASAFRSQLNDAIDWAQNASGKYTPSNVNKQRKEGAELEINTVISPNWSFMAGYSHLKVENKTSTASKYIRDIKNVQPNGYRLGLNYNKQAWDIGLNGSCASGRSLKTFTSSSYWVWDANVNYNFNKTMRVYLKVNNITDRAYEMLGNNGGPGAFPSPGRNYQFGVQYQF